MKPATAILDSNLTVDPQHVYTSNRWQIVLPTGHDIFFAEPSIDTSQGAGAQVSNSAIPNTGLSTYVGHGMREQDLGKIISPRRWPVKDISEAQYDASRHDALALHQRGAVASFRYNPLEDPQRQLRLLEILPGSTETDIRCRLATHGPRNAESSWDTSSMIPPYVAISYTWGSMGGTRKISVNGSRLNVGTNCHASLWQAYQSPVYSRYQRLWIDSICIDQSSVLEKNAQVERMGDTYRFANHVFACVGQHEDGSEALFEAIRCQDTASSRPTRNRRGSTDDSSSKSFLAFSQRSYWHRLWVLEELYLSPRVTVFCGDSSLPLGSIQRYEQAHGDDLSQDPVTPLRSVLHNMEGNRGKMPLSQALISFQSWECSEWRDHVYGLLAMVSWPPGMPSIKPDYAIFRRGLVAAIIPYLDAESLEPEPRRLAEKALYWCLGLDPSAEPLRVAALSEGWRRTIFDSEEWRRALISRE